MSGIQQHTTSRINWESRMPVVRTLLFLLAVILSLLLHAGLFWVLPPLPDARPTDWQTRSRPLPTVLGEVRLLQPEPAVVTLERFRPETPEAFAALEPMQRDLLENWRDQALDEIHEVPPPTAITTPPPTTPLEDYTESSFRQDILFIEQQSAAEELAALPRRTIEAVPRVSGAPDITLPATSGEIAAAAAHAVEGAATPVLSRATAFAAISAVEPDPEGIFDAIIQHAPDTTALLEEQGTFLDEPVADITDMTPIESLLDVHVSTYYAADENALYFEASISRAGAASLPILPKDVLLIQDSSESITRTKLDFFKAGIREYLPTLTTADRVNLMKYAVHPEFCFIDWQPVTSAALNEAWDFTSRMTARGQTDLFSSLQEALQVTRIPGRPVIALLMTDGRPTLGTMDSSDIIARFSRANRGGISIFTIGGGERVNTFLLDLLAYNNRGDAWILPRREQIPDGIKRAARELSRPVLANLTYHLADADQLEVYPHTLTHLFLDRPLRLIGRTRADAPSAILQIIGESGASRHDMVFALDFTSADNGGEGLRREWVMQKIYKLVNDRLTGARRTTLEEIHALSRKHNVPLPWPDLPLP